MAWPAHGQAPDIRTLQQQHAAALRQQWRTLPEGIVYRLDPEFAQPGNRPGDPERWFHGYRVLGKMTLATGAERREIYNALADAVAANTSGEADCFIPRHGLRYRTESGWVDCIICFQCRSVVQHRPDGTQGSFAIDASAEPALDSFLKRFHIPTTPTR